MRDKIIFGLTVVLVFIAGGLTTLIVAPEILIQTTDRDPVTRRPIEWNITARPLPDGVKTHIVGVTDDGRGMVSPSWVRADPGVGKILVDIENLFFWIDIQHSIRTASSFSRDYLGIERNEHDLTYTINLDVSIIGGPSAGAALTVATIAALENRSIDEDVVMTGTIEPDGRIGRVGGVLTKAQALEQAGFKKFVVPQGQSVQVTYTKEERCRTIGGIEICRTEYKEERIDIDREVEIEVVEAKNIEEALGYFL